MNIKNFFNKTVNSSSLSSKIESDYEYDIKEDITGYELWQLLHIGFSSKEDMKRWYENLPENVKRHIKVKQS